MKRIVVFYSMILFSMIVYAQSPLKATTPLIKVKNWDKKLYMIQDTYWDNDAKEIIGQIGEEEFNKVKAYSDYRTIPDQMALMVNGRKADFPMLYKNMDRLKMYKIAKYRHINENHDDKGLWAIVRVPYSENKEWDAKAQWNTVYFIIPDELVEELNK